MYVVGHFARCTCLLRLRCAATAVYGLVEGGIFGYERACREILLGLGCCFFRGAQRLLQERGT